MGRGNIIWDEPTMGIPVSWAPIALCQASLCLNVCSPQKEAFEVEDEVTFRPSVSASHISQWLAVTKSWNACWPSPTPIPAMLPEPAYLASSQGAPCREGAQEPPAGQLAICNWDAGLRPCTPSIYMQLEETILRDPVHIPSTQFPPMAPSYVTIVQLQSGSCHW